MAEAAGLRGKLGAKKEKKKGRRKEFDDIEDEDEGFGDSFTPEQIQAYVKEVIEGGV